MPAVVGVVGASGAGKTTFVEQVLPRLLNRAIRVGTIKHAPHGFQADRPGSDSARHAKAGADHAIVVGPVGYALFANGAPPTRTELADRYFADYDLVLAEGFSSEPGPRVLVHRRAVEGRGGLYGASVIFALTDEPLGFDVEVDPTDYAAAADLLAQHIGWPQGRT